METITDYIPLGCITQRMENDLAVVVIPERCSCGSRKGIDSFQFRNMNNL